MLTAWHTTGNLDEDMGAHRHVRTGNGQRGRIGTFTGALGFGACFTNAMCAPNSNWLAMGYPQAAPFTGGKIETCASSLGYVDAAVAGGLDSWAIGCDMTGGSSGGPWIFGFGRKAVSPAALSSTCWSATTTGDTAG